MSYAVLSCDLDTVDRHLQGYGFEDPEPCDLIYRTAVPRLLDLFAELGVPAVLFVIARDAERQQDLLRRAVSAGHEIASHSLTHPQPFSTLADAELREQIEVSRRRLSDASGRDVVGFRAPAWDVDERVLRMVREAGYRYDASVFPTPVLIASRLAAYRRSTGKRSIFSMDLLGHAFAPLRPHAVRRRRRRAGGVPDLGHAVAAAAGVPHVLLLRAGVALPPQPALAAPLRTCRCCYEFHAADLLDLAEDRVDPRMARHPGMRETLASKRALLRDTLGEIAAARRVTTYRAAVEGGTWN